MEIWEGFKKFQNNLTTGAVHCEVMHDYGTKAFLLQWDKFTAIRGMPGVAVSDCGSQLRSAKNSVAYPEVQAPQNWDWRKVESTGARSGTVWRFVPPGAQFRNGLAERRVAVLKNTMDHLLANTIISEKPTLSYAELQTLLSRAANIVNDRPIGVKGLTEDELVPLTVNQLLLGRTASVEPVQCEVEPEGYVAADQYVRELMSSWWKLWKQRALPYLLPYYKWQEAQRHKNLEPGDICLMLYESKVVGNYRLCRIIKAEPSDDGCVRTVTVGYLPRKEVRRAVYHPVPLEQKEVAVQRLVLIVPKEEQPSKQTAHQDDAYTSHYQELGPVEQPRAWTSTPTRSLSPTTRPAGAGWLYRAGPSQRLVAMSSVLCLTSPFLCVGPELDENYEVELPKNVVDPRYPSGPLSNLQPNALSNYEAITLSNYEATNPSYYESGNKKKVLPQSEIKLKDLSLSKYKTKDLPQSEIKLKGLSLSEHKMKDLPQSKVMPKTLPLSEFKTKDLPLSEIKHKDLPQYEMVSPSLPVFAYLPLLTKGTGGALTGHSTAAHQSLRSLPPALQPGIEETIKTEGLTGWSSLVKKVLTRTKCIKKEMKEMEVTLKPKERGIFEHHPPECQESRNSKASPESKDECRKCAGVEKIYYACADPSHEGPQTFLSIPPGRNVFNNKQTTDSIETLGQINMS